MKPLPAETAAIPKDAVLDHLREVLASDLFKGSERSTSLLQFLVEKTVSGQADRLKEYTLGTEALGKGPAFDPRIDPIVRAEVSRLRARLDKYYATEGKDDALVIALSKGSYAPQFQTREAVPSRPAGLDPKPASRLKNFAWFALGLGVAACVFAIVMLSLWRVARPEGAISIAVLPFVNVSADPGQEFFSDGMTDEIAEALTKVPDLRIVARSSAYTFKTQNKPAGAIGRALGATHLIEGSVRQAGNRVRITAQLIEARNGLQLWSQSYDRDLTDVFAIQEDIATAIAGALRTPLGLKQGERLVANRTEDVDSYQQYLRARALVRARMIPAAIAILDLAVAHDPNYAPAWAMLAQAYDLAPNQYSVQHNDAAEGLRHIVDESLPRAETAARRAIQLDANLADGYLALARVEDRRGKTLLAEELYSKTLVLDPNNADALHAYSLLLAAMGHIKEALAMRLKLQALEPFVPIFTFNTAFVLWLDGQNEAAIALAKGLPPLFGQIVLSTIYASMGRYREAADLIMEQTAVSNDTAAVDAAVRLLRTAPAQTTAPQSLPRLGLLGPIVYPYVGAAERVLDFPEGQLEAGYLVGITNAQIWHPAYAPARKTERFNAFARKAGMVDYWRKRGWPDLCRPLGAEDFACD